MDPDYTSLIPLAIFGLFLLITAVAVFFNLLNARKRREALQNLALERGWQYSADDPSSSLAAGGNDLFQRGRNRRVFNVLSGYQGGAPFHIFDYRYTTGSGRHSHTHFQTVASLQPQDTRLVSFHVRPQHIFDKIAVSFGRQDINFDDRPDFSKQYRLMGEDEASVRSLFSPAVLAYFEQQKGLAAECDGTRLIVYSLERQLKVEELSEMVDRSIQLANLLRRSTPSFEPYDFGVNR